MTELFPPSTADLILFTIGAVFALLVIIIVVLYRE